MTLYQIIRQLQDTPGTNDKLAILQEHKDNELLKLYIETTLSPRINFYITKKTLPKLSPNGADWAFSELTINAFQETIASRQLTGDAGKQWIKNAMNAYNEEGRQLIEWMLLKDFRAKVGETLVAKVWPEFASWTPKYMRCSLPKDVKLDTWPWEGGVISQVKADGMYVEVGPEGIFTRNGSKLDHNLLNSGLQEDYYRIARLGVTFTGELTVYAKNAIAGFILLDRKTGNGILNSVLSGNPLPDDYRILFTAWDYITTGSVAYRNRLAYVCSELSNMKSMVPIESKTVYSYKEAVTHFMECTASDLEGTVIKNPNGKWKDGTSKDQVKMKIEAEVDLRVIGMVEGNGKNAGQCGALQLTSEDGKVLVDCGTGLSDAIRQEIFDNFDDQWLGKIVTVKANDLLDKRGSDTLSLFLPVFIELRKDKDVADTAEPIKAIFDSAKGLV